jgi:hypothetical protein
MFDKNEAGGVMGWKEDVDTTNKTSNEQQPRKIWQLVEGGIETVMLHLIFCAP